MPTTQADYSFPKKSVLYYKKTQARDTKLMRKPDLLFIILIAFGVGVLVTLLLPLAANDTVAAPASELLAGVIIQD